MPARINPELAKAEQCRRSLFKFVQEFWSTIIPEDPVWNWHIEYLCDEIQRDVLRVCKLPAQRLGGIELPAKNRESKLHDLLINVPPGSSKSTILTIMMPAWAWSIDATLRILSASYSGDLSLKLAVKSRDIIQSEKYRQYFPYVQIRADENNKTNYINTAGGERFATSVGGTSTGVHFHLLICDDLINPKQAASQSQLEEAAMFMSETLSRRKVDSKVTLTALIMQRLNELDPAGIWLKKRDNEGKELKHICLPAELSRDVFPISLRDKYVEGLFDPVRMDKEALRDAKIDLGSYGYAGQMLQNPAPEGGGIWQKWFIPVPDKDFPAINQFEGYGTDWDTAYTDNKANASSAAVVSGRIDKKVYIDRVAWFNKEFPALIHTMRNDFPDPHYIEAKASGKSAKQTLVTAGIPAIEVQVNGDKIARAKDASPKAESGMIYVRASILDKIYYDSDQGLLKFPNGAKQDLADTIAQAIQRHLGKSPRELIVGWRLRDKTPV